MKKEVKVYSGRAGLAGTKPPVKVDSSRNGVSRIKTDRFILTSLEFGIRSFIFPGITWWFIVVVYYCFKLSMGGISALLSKNVLLSSAVFLIFVLLSDIIRLPLIYIAIKYLKNEKSVPSDLQKSLSHLWYYFLACLLSSAVIVLPAKIFIFAMRNISNYSGLFIVGIISSIWMVYWSCRLFPYFFIVIDRKLGPIEAFNYSSKITSGNLIPVFLFVVVLAVIGAFAKMIPFHIGTIIFTPFVVLSTVHACRILDQNWQQVE